MLFEVVTAARYAQCPQVREVSFVKETTQPQPDLRIPDVAERCGFSTVESFNRAFRQTVGSTPAAFRRSRRGVSA